MTQFGLASAHSSMLGHGLGSDEVGGRSDEGTSPSMVRSGWLGYDVVGRELWCRFLEILHRSSGKRVLDFEKCVPRDRRDPSWDVPETRN